jgi:hypothetical protein
MPQEEEEEEEEECTKMYIIFTARAHSHLTV